MADKNDEEDERYEPLTWRDRAYNRFQRVSFYVYTVVLAILFLTAVLWQRVFIIIPSGHHGVKYEPLREGTVTDPRLIYGEGIHVIAPWDELYIYETRLQQRFLDFDMLSDEGLGLEVVVSVRFRPERNMLGFLHQDIGTDYYERLIEPEVEGHVRETLGHRPAHEIYSSAGDLIQELNRVSTLSRIGDAASPYVMVQEVKLVHVGLPAIVEEAIADRYRQEQLRLEYDDRVAREEKEAQRKRIEAKGIADYNEIIGDDALLWREIDAVKELAKSPNAKVLMLGNNGGEGNMPLIFSLGMQDAIAPGDLPKDDSQLLDPIGPDTPSNGPP